MKYQEVWIDVPATAGRYQISNKGRLRQIAKKVRLGKTTRTLHTDTLIPLLLDYRTGELGWHVYFDGEKHFWPRDEMLKFFYTVPTEINPADEEQAKELYNSTYRPEIATRQQLRQTV